MSTSQKHIDLTYLRTLSNGDKGFIKEMISLFIDQTPDMLARMSNYLNLQDWKALSSAAHKMKPSVMFVGLKETEKDLKKVEDYSAERKNTADIPIILARINEVCKVAVDELKNEKEYLA